MCYYCLLVQFCCLTVDEKLCPHYVCQIAFLQSVCVVINLVHNVILYSVP